MLNIRRKKNIKYTRIMFRYMNKGRVLIGVGTFSKYSKDMIEDLLIINKHYVLDCENEFVYPSFPLLKVLCETTKE